jgi:hypothetical protein
MKYASSRVRALAWLALAVGVAAWGAVARASEDRPVAATNATTAEVNMRVVRVMLNRCRYVATVRGVLAMHGSGIEAGAAAQYRSQLTVDAEVDCGSGVLHHVAPTRVDGLYARPDLEQAIEDATTVNADAGGRVCAFRPSFRVRGASVANTGLRVECRRDTPLGP